MRDSESIDDNTPIIVGVGQCSQARSDDKKEWHSHADLTALSATAAMEDTNVSGIEKHIDAMVAVRTFADSSPSHGCPFGGPSNFPGAVAKRIGANPDFTLYEVLGGQAPQKLMGEFMSRLWQGEFRMVMLMGGEVISTINSAQRAGARLDWAEAVDGQFEDRGLTGGHPVITRMEFEHQLMLPMQFYGMIEHARRNRLGKSASDYSKAMAAELAPFSQVAAQNPYAVNRNEYSPEQLLEQCDSNPLIVSPYPKRLIAKDNVNQAAATLLTTVGEARKLGISEDKWVYLHAYSDLNERVLLERDDLGASTAMEWAFNEVFRTSGLSTRDIEHFDIYSCFPVVVSLARDILGIPASDPRRLTVTGGLPFFGGPGNNYSMHGIAAMVEVLRQNPGEHGLVYANGGVMSKHSVGIYSCLAPTEPWKPCSSEDLQKALNDRDIPGLEYAPDGDAVIETYTINYLKGEPLSAVIVARMVASNKRCFALTNFQDSQTFNAFISSDPLGRQVVVKKNPKGNQFAFSQARLKEITPAVIDTFQKSYDYCKVERQDHLLIVTINRPDVHNALHPLANEELQGVFNAFEKDDDLWVAILTGAGKETFSSGNDLKYMAKGGQFWVPETGFAGLTNRQNRTKPIIAAVNGSALGGGLEIVMSCDIVIAANHAQFSLPEVKVGLIAGAGGIQRLPRQIGLKPAMRMMLTGDAIDVSEARQLGLINEYVPGEQLLTRAIAMADRIISASPTSIRCTMDLHNQSSRYPNVDDAVNGHFNTFDKLLNSEDFFEGPRAFAEKRTPRWTGK